MEAVWSRNYETIITEDMRYLVAAGYGVPALQMMQSASACILDSELIVHCLVGKDLAKCRDSAGARAARVDHLLMVSGSAGPEVLFPFSKQRYVRPGEPEHVTVKKYLELFHQLIPLDDINLPELVVRTTGYRAEIVGKYAPEAACMQARITGAIRADGLDEMSGLARVPCWPGHVVTQARQLK